MEKIAKAVKREDKLNVESRTLKRQTSAHDLKNCKVRNSKDVGQLVEQELDSGFTEKVRQVLEGKQQQAKKMVKKPLLGPYYQLPLEHKEFYQEAVKQYKNARELLDNLINEKPTERQSKWTELLLRERGTWTDPERRLLSAAHDVVNGKYNPTESHSHSLSSWFARPFLSVRWNSAKSNEAISDCWVDVEKEHHNDLRIPLLEDHSSSSSVDTSFSRLEDHSSSSSVWEHGSDLSDKEKEGIRKELKKLKDDPSHITYLCELLLTRNVEKLKGKYPKESIDVVVKEAKRSIPQDVQKYINKCELCLDKEGITRVLDAEDMKEVNKWKRTWMKMMDHKDFIKCDENLLNGLVRTPQHNPYLASLALYNYGIKKLIG